MQLERADVEASVKDPIMTLSPVWTKPRVLMLASTEAAAESTSYTSMRPAPVPPFFPARMAV